MCWDNWHKIGPVNILPLGRRALEDPNLGLVANNESWDRRLRMSHLFLSIYGHLIVSGDGRNIFFSGIATSKEAIFLKIVLHPESCKHP